jgi:hypothetical protein
MQRHGVLAVVVVVISLLKKRRVRRKKIRMERRRRARRRKKARRKKRRKVHVVVVVSGASKQTGKKVISTLLLTEVSLCSKNRGKTPNRVMHTPRHTFVYINTTHNTTINIYKLSTGVYENKSSRNNPFSCSIK